MEKRFSIIIPAYNVEQYIEEAIKSVLEQDFQNYELILIDDCSTDNTKNLLEKYRSERTKVYSTNKNTGTAAGPRNVGLNYATGEYVLFLDGDDKLYNNKVLGKIDKLISNEKYDVVYLGYQDIGNSDKMRVSNNYNSTKEARIICDITFSVSSRCWNRDFIEKNNMWWPQMSDLQGWGSQAIFSYGVNVYPYNIIFDKNGRILRKGIKLSELQGYLGGIAK